MLRILTLAAVLAACTDSSNPELVRHERAFNGTYMTPSPWQEAKPSHDNPEDGPHVRTVPGRGYGE